VARRCRGLADGAHVACLDRPALLLALSRHGRGGIGWILTAARRLSDWADGPWSRRPAAVGLGAGIRSPHEQDPDQVRRCLWLRAPSEWACRYGRVWCCWRASCWSRAGGRQGGWRPASARGASQGGDCIQEPCLLLLWPMVYFGGPLAAAGAAFRPWDGGVWPRFCWALVRAGLPQAGKAVSTESAVQLQRCKA